MQLHRVGVYEVDYIFPPSFFRMEDIQLSATSYFRNALSVAIRQSPKKIFRKLDALDQCKHGDEALEALGT